MKPPKSRICKGCERAFVTHGYRGCCSKTCSEGSEVREALRPKKSCNVSIATTGGPDPLTQLLQNVNVLASTDEEAIHLAKIEVSRTSIYSYNDLHVLSINVTQ